MNKLEVHTYIEYCPLPRRIYKKREKANKDQNISYHILLELTTRMLSNPRIVIVKNVVNLPF